jgi:hypothetical protein
MSNRFAHYSVLVAGLAVFTNASLHADQHPLSETAKAIADAKSGQCDWTTVANQAGAGKLTSRTLWIEDAARSETLVGEKVVAWDVRRKGKPGLTIDRRSRTYIRTNATKEYHSPLHQIAAMKSVSPEKLDDLGKKRIGDVDARGFRTAVRNLDADAGADGTLSVWVDEISKLPLLVVLEYSMGQTRIDGFKWNISFQRELFDVEPPENYEDATPAPINEAQLAQIVGALKTYAVVYGHYPKVDKIYGDVISAELRKKMGIPTDSPRSALEHKNYPRFLDASYGWQWITVIQKENADYKYFGKTVGPKDGGKVLAHWKLEDENYRVIYGDLKTEKVAAARLQSLLENK